jgi:hypothetical protein
VREDRQLGKSLNIGCGVRIKKWYTIVSSVSIWCKVLCTFVASEDTIVITPLGLRWLVRGQSAAISSDLRWRVHDGAGRDILHVPPVFFRCDVRLVLLLECLEAAHGCTMHVSRYERDSYTFRTREVLELLDEPIALFLCQESRLSKSSFERDLRGHYLVVSGSPMVI